MAAAATFSPGAAATTVACSTTVSTAAAETAVAVQAAERVRDVLGLAAARAPRSTVTAIRLLIGSRAAVSALPALTSRRRDAPHSAVASASAVASPAPVSAVAALATGAVATEVLQPVASGATVRWTARRKRLSTWGYGSAGRRVPRPPVVPVGVVLISVLPERILGGVVPVALPRMRRLREIALVAVRHRRRLRSRAEHGRDEGGNGASGRKEVSYLHLSPSR